MLPNYCCNPYILTKCIFKDPCILHNHFGWIKDLFGWDGTFIQVNVQMRGSLEAATAIPHDKWHSLGSFSS